MQADKIKKPLLLIHGEDDTNTGTFPMQSERFFSALKGHGAVTRLVVLPHESHGYRWARFWRRFISSASSLPTHESGFIIRYQCTKALVLCALEIVAN